MNCVDLRRDRLDDARVRVADAGHGDAGAEVDERVAVDVDEHAAAGRRGEDRHGRADAGGDGLRLALEQLRSTSGRGWR